MNPIASFLSKPYNFVSLPDIKKSIKMIQNNHFLNGSFFKIKSATIGAVACNIQNWVCIICCVEAYYNLQNPSAFLGIPIAYGFDASFLKHSVEYNTLDTLGKALSESFADGTNTLSNLAWDKAHYAVFQAFSMGYKWTAMLFSSIYFQHLLVKLDSQLSYKSKQA